MFKDIKENIDIIIEDMGNLYRESETVKEKHGKILELNGLNSIIETAKERVGKLKQRLLFNKKANNKVI